jgi:D-alanine transaminase
MLSYFNGSYIDDDDIKISPYDHGFLFGDGVYDVIHTYDGKMFRFGQHFERLQRGMSRIGIKAPDTNDLIKAIEHVSDHNLKEVPDGIIYIQVTRGTYKPRTHIIPEDVQVPTVYISASIVDPPHEQLENGVSIILEKDIRWELCDIKTISLLASTLGKQKAIDAGAYEGVWVRNGWITEGTHTNFAAIKDGKFYTPPLSKFILPGITRSVVLEICKKNGIAIIDKNIRAKDLKDFDEIMVLGTRSEITPVTKVDDWSVDSGYPGEVTRFLQAEIDKIKRG